MIYVRRAQVRLTARLHLQVNGGPGCSSIGGGYIEEHGPWLYQPSPADGSLMYTDIALTPNPYTWAATANMVRFHALEAP